MADSQSVSKGSIPFGGTYGSVAQLVEREILNLRAVGSSPTGITLGVAQRLEPGPDTAVVAGSNPVTQIWKAGYWCIKRS